MTMTQQEMSDLFDEIDRAPLKYIVRGGYGPVRAVRVKRETPTTITVWEEGFFADKHHKSSCKWFDTFEEAKAYLKERFYTNMLNLENQLEGLKSNLRIVVAQTEDSTVSAMTDRFNRSWDRIAE